MNALTHFKPDDIAAGPAELDADQVNRLAERPVFVGVTFILDLLERLSLRAQFHDVELERGAS